MSSLVPPCCDIRQTGPRRDAALIRRHDGSTSVGWVLWNDGISNDTLSGSIRLRKRVRPFPSVSGNTKMLTVHRRPAPLARGGGGLDVVSPRGDLAGVGVLRPELLGPRRGAPVPHRNPRRRVLRGGGEKTFPTCD